MKLNTTPRVNVDAETARWYREIARQVNGLSEGTMAATYQATDTVPTASVADGDFVKKLTRVQAGTAGSKYILDGWEHIGGTWYERRYLTGN